MKTHIPNPRRMKILITGHRGFVGDAFVKYFLQNEDQYDLYGCDIVENQDAREVFRKDTTQFDLVIHLAAIIGGRATIEGEPLKVAVDLSIDAELFQWAVRTKPGAIVYYSSSAAYPIELQGYGSAHKLKESDINLDDVRQPDLSYGWSKLTGEMLARWAELEGVRTHVFRPFSGYGETQSLDYPFPSFITRGIRRDDPFEVWGSGMQTRDFIHIDDIVEATITAVKLGINGAVNLGTGRATSFDQLAQIVAAECRYSPRIEHIIGAPEGVAYRVADTTRLNTFYTPKITLEEGVARAVKALSLA